MAETVDAVVIGAGVVGLAVARALALVGRDVLVLERNNRIGAETSSRNSEVIHAGIYYPPGSLKARLCRDGKHMLYAYCAERGIGHRQCGKLIVAGDDGQRPALSKIISCAEANGVTDLELLTADACIAREPEVRAVGGLFSPSTGIIDSHDFMTSLQGDLEAAGGMVVLNTAVTDVAIKVGQLTVVTGGPEAMTLRPRSLVNAAGLGAPALAGGIVRDVPPLHLAIGHYYALSGKSPFRHLVYPLPADGGLGVHVTLDLAGQARFGPDVRWIEGVDYSFDDTRRDDFIDAIRTYYPGLDSARLSPAYTGIRPKLVGPGEAAADFRIDGPDRHGVDGLVNLFGIESPGLTAALAIADEVCARIK